MTSQTELAQVQKVLVSISDIYIRLRTILRRKQLGCSMDDHIRGSTRHAREHERRISSELSPLGVFQYYLDPHCDETGTEDCIYSQSMSHCG